MCFSLNTNVYQKSLSGDVHWVTDTLVIYLGFLPHAANIKKESTCPWRKEENEKVGKLSTYNFNVESGRLGILDTSLQKSKSYCVQSN